MEVQRESEGLKDNIGPIGVFLIHISSSMMSYLTLSIPLHSVTNLKGSVATVTMVYFFLCQLHKDFMLLGSKRPQK